MSSQHKAQIKRLFSYEKPTNHQITTTKNEKNDENANNDKNINAPQQQLNTWFKENYPFVSKLKLPKPEQMTKLKKLYGEKAIYDTLEAMENYKPLQNYRDAYLTLNKWLKKQKPTKDHTTNNPEILDGDIRGQTM